MAQDLFNIGTSNNAPAPIPGGYGNPTGANTGALGNNGVSANAFPNYPAFGPIGATPTAQTTTSGLNSSPYNSSSFAGLSTGLQVDPSLQGNLLKEFQRAYGKGTGDVLMQMLTTGLFNPQTASAYLNSMQPGIQRGQADILNAFGRGGDRFSSSAALGLGDYNSQVNLNENSTLASLYQNAQTNELNLLGNTLPTLNKEEDNSGGGWIDDLLGGLEIAGGVAAAPFTGGLSLGLAGSGTGLLAMGLGGKTATSPQPTPMYQNIGTQSPTASQNAQEIPVVPQSMLDQFYTNNLSGSAGSLFGGSPNTTTNDFGQVLF